MACLEILSAVQAAGDQLVVAPEQPGSRGAGRLKYPTGQDRGLQLESSRRGAAAAGPTAIRAVDQDSPRRCAKSAIRSSWVSMAAP